MKTIPKMPFEARDKFGKVYFIGWSKNKKYLVAQVGSDKKCDLVFFLRSQVKRDFELVGTEK